LVLKEYCDVGSNTKYAYCVGPIYGVYSLDHYIGLRRFLFTTYSRFAAIVVEML